MSNLTSLVWGKSKWLLRSSAKRSSLSTCPVAHFLRNFGFVNLTRRSLQKKDSGPGGVNDWSLV